MKAEGAKAAHEAIVKAGINFVACLPDSAFQELYIHFQTTRGSRMFKSPVKTTALAFAWALGWKG